MSGLRDAQGAEFIDGDRVPSLTASQRRREETPSVL